MNFDSTVLEIAGKVNKILPLALGDAVIHKATRLCGHVSAVESFGSTNGQMVSVLLLNGKTIRGLRREEFGLHKPGPEQIRAQRPRVVETPTPTQENLQVTLNGPISDISILDELC